MKPRIFIAIHYLETGGAESALIGMLNAMDPRRADVDLFIYRHSGSLMQKIPSWVRVLPEIGAYASVETPVLDTVRRGHIAVAAARWLARRRLKRHVLRDNPPDWSAHFGYIGRYTSAVLPSLRRFGHYDLAISYLTPHDYVLRHVDASRRACWIHTDYTSIGVDTRFEFPVWNAYDTIVSISPSVTDAFCRCFPSLRPKIVEIANMISPDIVRTEHRRPDDMPKTPGRLQLLTVGRYSRQKNLDAIPGLCRRLRERGLDVEWYIIGYGDSDSYIRSAIMRENMRDHVIILGKRSNPYPYIAACDWYVQPSIYEGKSVVVEEARMLGKPVIATAYPTVSSQICDGVDGVTVPLETEACADAIYNALSDNKLREKITAAISTRDYSNSREIEKLYSLLP